MLVKVKAFFLLITVFILSGCNDSLTINFKLKVDQVDQAEEELNLALGDMVKIHQFDWLRKDQSDQRYSSVTMTFEPREENANYSLKQVTDTINQLFSVQQHAVSLAVDIKEKNLDILEMLSLNNGDHFSAELNWQRAKADIFYIQKSYNSNRIEREYFCAIKAPLKDDIPIISYGYNGKGSKLLEVLFKDMVYEAENNKTITGLPIDNQDFKIKLESSRKQKDKFGPNDTVFLIFDTLGKKTYNKYEVSGINPPSTPSGATKSECEKFIYGKTHFNFFGVAGHVSAIDNVVSIQNK